MGFFEIVQNHSIVGETVVAHTSYIPNSIFYLILYFLALPPTIILAYLSLKPGLITSRVRFPTLGMTLANLYGVTGFIIVISVYLTAVTQNIKISFFFASFLRTILYNTTYVCYFLFPVLAIDQWLMVCHNYTLTPRGLTYVISICFTIPMLVGIYDLFLQNTILHDYMFMYIRMSPYSNIFFFFVLSPSFFIFSFICNLFVLSSIVQRQSKTARKQIGRTLNPRQLQQQKSIVFIYMLQAFLPLLLAAPYYIANVCFMVGVEIELYWFVIGEAIIGMHPLTNALTTLLLLKPYRQALRNMFRGKTINQRRYDSIRQHDDRIEGKETDHDILEHKDSTKESKDSRDSRDSINSRASKDTKDYIEL